jgi:hypothetical protein
VSEKFIIIGKKFEKLSEKIFNFLVVSEISFSENLEN